ncbi:hypothetical protein V6N13_074521 [Hibiscus sabdariffa]|uniref:Uncharacterized protein n=1 Tax=Hibiscus sabdariffa TaxID=183260 RepID=A0ABR2U8S7_9ROSI
MSCWNFPGNATFDLSIRRFHVLSHESYWKFVAASDFDNGKHQSSILLTWHGCMGIRNQTTCLPWITTTVKFCFSAMVEGFVLQGSGDKEEGDNGIVRHMGGPTNIMWTLFGVKIDAISFIEDLSCNLVEGPNSEFEDDSFRTLDSNFSGEESDRIVELYALCP